MKKKMYVKSLLSEYANDFFAPRLSFFVYLFWSEPKKDPDGRYVTESLGSSSSVYPESQRMVFNFFFGRP